MIIQLMFVTITAAAKVHGNDNIISNNDSNDNVIIMIMAIII